MHEVGLMQTALEMALEQAHRAGARRIHRVSLRVGAMSGVVPEALRFAFAATSRGTAADGAELLVEHVPVVCVCKRCSAEFDPMDVVYLCPNCGEISSHVKQGRELELASLEVS